MTQPADLSGQTRLAIVIGDPVRHSLSPAIHNAAFAACDLDWVFLACEVPEGRAPEALAGALALGIEGLSVTMPHKAAVAATVDDLSSAARLLGAVNCVARQGDRLVGHNTDGGGFTDALAAEAGWSPAGARCVVLGAGGAARAVALALAEAAAAEVAIVNRSPRNAVAAAALAGDRGRVAEVGEVGGFDLVVNATPLGMRGHSGAPMPSIRGCCDPISCSWTSSTSRPRRPCWQRRELAVCAPSTASGCWCTRPPGPSNCGPAPRRRSTPWWRPRGRLWPGAETRG